MVFFTVGKLCQPLHLLFSLLYLLFRPHHLELPELPRQISVQLAELFTPRYQRLDHFDRVIQFVSGSVTGAAFVFSEQALNHPLVTVRTGAKRLAPGIILGGGIQLGSVSEAIKNRTVHSFFGRLQGLYLAALKFNAIRQLAPLPASETMGGIVTPIGAKLNILTTTTESISLDFKPKVILITKM